MRKLYGILDDSLVITPRNLVFLKISWSNIEFLCLLSYDVDMKDIIGRKKEYDRLDRCMKENEAQLIIVYGRFRIGKTYLIDKYFNNNYAFKLTGEYKESRTVQLNNFIQELKSELNLKI